MQLARALDFAQVVVIVVVSAPAFLLISEIFPQLRVCLFLFWLATFIFDAYTTIGFYKPCPERFSQLERNKVLVLFVEKLGFKRGFVAFTLLFLIPFTVFFGVAFLPIVYTRLIGSTLPDFAATVASAFGVVGVEHVQAALKNISANKREEKGRAMVAQLHMSERT